MLDAARGARAVTDFHLDSDVSLRLAHRLRDAGHGVVAARDLGLDLATDDAQHSSAVNNGRLLVTHNRRDFTLLHDAWRSWSAEFGLTLPAHQGILALDQGAPDRLVRAIEVFLATTLPSSHVNEMFWWRVHGGWRRRIGRTGWAPVR